MDPLVSYVAFSLAISLGHRWTSFCGNQLLYYCSSLLRKKKNRSYFQENLDNDFKKTATSSSHTISKRKMSVTQFLRKIASIDLVVQLFWVYPSLHVSQVSAALISKYVILWLVRDQTRYNNRRWERGWYWVQEWGQNLLLGHLLWLTVRINQFSFVSLTSMTCKKEWYCPACLNCFYSHF